MDALQNPPPTHSPLFEESASSLPTRYSPPATHHSPPATTSLTLRPQVSSTLINVFAELADLFGNPRSHGQVFGALFASTEPLTQENLTAQLRISPASVSLALRALESFGAVEKIPAPSARGQATYIAHTALRPLVLGFIRNRLLPKLAASEEKLKSLELLIGQMDSKEAAELRVRIERIQNWHKRASQVLGAADHILKVVVK